MIKKILYHPNFEKHYRKLPEIIKIKAEKKEKIFRENFQNPQLKTHKLSGRLKEFYSFSVDDSYRILFKFYESNIVIFLDIGTHEIYKK